MSEDRELNDKLQHELCEIVPTTCEDSGRAEWTVGELQKMIDAFMEITEYLRYRKELKESSDRIKELEAEVEKEAKLVEVWMDKCASLRSQVKKLRNILKEIQIQLEPMADCDHNGIAFVGNLENNLCVEIDQALAETEGE